MKMEMEMETVLLPHLTTTDISLAGTSPKQKWTRYFPALGVGRSTMQAGDYLEPV